MKSSLQRTFGRIGHNWGLYLLLLPSLILLIIFSYKPMYGVIIAFKDYKNSLGIVGSPWADPLFKHFIRFFNSFQCGTTIKNTLALSLYSMLVGFPIPIILALMINQITAKRFRKGFQTVLYLPHFISTVVMVGLLLIWLSPSRGLLGAIFSLFGKTAPNIMGNASAFRSIYVWSDVWQHAGWDSIVFLAALSSIDPTLYEAAVVDGASRWQKQIYIDLPLLLPTACIMLILRAGGIMNVGFEKVFLMQNSLNQTTSEVIATYVYKMGLKNNQYSVSTAVNLFNNVINFALLIDQYMPNLKKAFEEMPALKAISTSADGHIYSLPSRMPKRPMGNHSHPPSDKTEKGLINMTTIFTDKNYRITFLTSRLVRFEYQENGCFEDRFTTGVQNRDFPAVKVDSNRSSRGLELDTEYLHIVYDGKVFSSNGLCISVKGNVSAYQSTWRYGEQFSTLGGTARTLDGADGEIPVENGLVSRNGFSILDDSQSMILTKDGQFIPREYIENDFYFFGYGHDYQQCLKDYYLLSGAVPLLPRYALGNWWSRFHEYSEESYLKLMERFEQENIPLSVAVIDMDWHLTDVPYGSGWTGYTWNKSLFPDPRRFLTALHNRGMHTTLNLHPAGGVEPHEEAYSAMCEALGRNPEDKQCIDFDASDEQFLKEYIKYLHHPAEEDGVDFWWIDWQQGKESAVKGLDPLWVLNEKHYSDNQRKGKRGLILSRYAGPGSHRTPVGFSGDTIMSWASLAFQPEFTAMASNAGYPWWSHDIGGHMRGIRNDELSVRWLQLGVFSPIMRLHSGKMYFASKEPWTYGKEAERIMGEYLRLRHTLIPYLYSVAERTHRLGEALIRPVYYQWPEQEEAYQMRNQYLFGTSLMVCPITEPMNQEIKMGNVKVWIPEGFWYDFMTGQVYSGDRILSIWRDLESYPVFAPAGAIVPLADTLNANENPSEMTMRIFGGKSGRFDLYEDDGISLKENAVWTHIEFDWEKGIISIKTEGNRSFLPKKRTWHIEVVGIKASQVSKEDASLCCTYNQERNALCFSIEMFRENEEMTLSISDLKLSQDNWLMRVAQRLQMAQTENDEKEMIWNLLNKKGRAPSVLGTIRATCSSSALVDCLAEVLFAQDEKEGEKK